MCSADDDHLGWALYDNHTLESFAKFSESDLYVREFYEYNFSNKKAIENFYSNAWCRARGMVSCFLCSKLVGVSCSFTSWYPNTDTNPVFIVEEFHKCLLKGHEEAGRLAPETNEKLQNIVSNVLQKMRAIDKFALEHFAKMKEKNETEHKKTMREFHNRRSSGSWPVQKYADWTEALNYGIDKFEKIALQNMYSEIKKMRDEILQAKQP